MCLFIWFKFRDRAAGNVLFFVGISVYLFINNFIDNMDRLVM